MLLRAAAPSPPKPRILLELPDFPILILFQPQEGVGKNLPGCTGREVPEFQEKNPKSLIFGTSFVPFPWKTRMASCSSFPVFFQVAFFLPLSHKKKPQNEFFLWEFSVKSWNLNSLQAFVEEEFSEEELFGAKELLDLLLMRTRIKSGKEKKNPTKIL